MKLITVLLFLITFCLQANTTYSQNVRVKLDMKNASLTDIFRKIEKQSDYRFFCNYTVLNAGTRVNVHTDEKELSEILDQLFKNTDITCKLVDKYIVITSKNETVVPLAAQSSDRKILTGVVTDERGEPIVGANVVEKGTTNGSITNMNGEFTISVSEYATLQVSYIGYISQEIQIKNRTQLQIILKEDLHTLEEVVVVGYNTQKKKDLTGAVSVVKVEDAKDHASGNIMKALQGRVPGAFITSSGAPNGDATVLIRGIGTLGDNSPLYIIDGMPSKKSMNELSALDIESIQVLKDASAASIYGSRAAHGVIIITTKKGKRKNQD